MAEARSNYILCSNPRSGTTLMCTMLEQTGVAGRPNSFFRQASLQAWSEDWGVTTRADPMDPTFTAQYFTAMRAEGLGGTEVFGLRLMGADLSFACDWLRRCYPELPSDLARMNMAFDHPHFIHLSRRDKLAEAISYIRAEQSGLWHGHSDGTAMETMPPIAEQGYDAAAISARLTQLRDFDLAWEDWFQTQGITPMRISYEELADDPQRALGQMLSYIGQDEALALRVKPRVRKLADHINAEWTERYLHEHPAKRVSP